MIFFQTRAAPPISKMPLAPLADPWTNSVHTKPDSNEAEVLFLFASLRLYPRLVDSLSHCVENAALAQ